MKLINYTELLEQYKGYYDLNEHCLPQRMELLKQNPYSVILEAEHNEIDSLDAWIKYNLADDKIEFIYYSKTSYDYGCAEYFGSNESNIDRLKEVIPIIYTLYPDSYPPNQRSKTNGSGIWIEYNPNDNKGILVNLE